MYRLIFLLIFISCSLEAHQPKLVYQSPTKENPFKVNDPEISKAFYGQLKGVPHYFKIDSDRQFLFYTGILSPKVNSTYQSLSLDVIDKNNTIIFQADGESFQWNAWYEPYARDY